MLSNRNLTAVEKIVSSFRNTLSTQGLEMVTAAVSILCVYFVPMGEVTDLAFDNNVVLFFLLIIFALSIADGLRGFTRNGSSRTPFAHDNSGYPPLFYDIQLGISASLMGIFFNNSRAPVQLALAPPQITI